jgi:hypothetical protein
VILRFDPPPPADRELPETPQGWDADSDSDETTTPDPPKSDESDDVEMTDMDEDSFDSEMTDADDDDNTPTARRF